MPFVIACVGSEFLRSLLTRLRASIDNINIISNILRSISADIFKDERFFKSREKLWSVQMLESFFNELLDRRSILMGARAARRPLFNKAYLAVKTAITQCGTPDPRELNTVATAMMSSVGVCHQRIYKLGCTLSTYDLNQIRFTIAIERNKNQPGAMGKLPMGNIPTTTGSEWTFPPPRFAHS